MRKILLLSLLFSITACKSKRLTADSPEKYEIEKLAQVISKNDLEKVYPDAEIAEGVDFFEEGTVEKAYTILYPETQDEILLIWNDRNRTQLFQIFYKNDGRWKSNKGIEIGTPYEDLVEINGGPIDVYGFGWDYSGAVDWKDGKMADSKVRVFLEPQNAPPKRFYGDHIIDSSVIEDIIDLKLRVRAIVFQNSF